MDTETRLMATAEQARALITQLGAAIALSKETGEAAYARVILEQMDGPGPWRLILGVVPEER